MPLIGRRKKSPPQRHTHDQPSWPGAYLFTLRSVPRHYYTLKDAIETTGDARVWFGEPLAYIRGKGVAIFRVEATGFSFLDALYERWREIERREAFTFEIELYLNNTQWAASLRTTPPEQIQAIISNSAPKFQPEGAAARM